MSRWRNLGLLICLTGLVAGCAPDDAVPESWLCVRNQTPDGILAMVEDAGTFAVLSGGQGLLMLPSATHEVFVFSHLWGGWRPVQVVVYGTQTWLDVWPVWPPTVSHAPPE